MSNIAPACAPYEADLSALLDGELAPGRAAAVQAHLDSCADCRERHRRLCEVDLALAELPVAAVPADLRSRLDGRITGAAPAPGARPAPPRSASAGAPRRRRRGLSRRTLLAGLSAAAAVALYVVVNRGGGVPGGERGRVAPPVAIVEPALPPAPETATPEAPPAAVVAEVPQPAPADLAGASDEELAVVLELETIEELDLIANLDLLERLIALEREARG